jgi:ribonuclease HI
MAHFMEPRSAFSPAHDPDTADWETMLVWNEPILETLGDVGSDWVVAINVPDSSGAAGGIAALVDRQGQVTDAWEDPNDAIVIYPDGSSIMEGDGRIVRSGSGAFWWENGQPAGVGHNTGEINNNQAEIDGCVIGCTATVQRIKDGECSPNVRRIIARMDSTAAIIALYKAYRARTVPKEYPQIDRALLLFDNLQAADIKLEMHWIHSHGIVVRSDRLVR